MVAELLNDFWNFGWSIFIEKKNFNVKCNFAILQIPIENRDAATTSSTWVNVMLSLIMIL